MREGRLPMNASSPEVFTEQLIDELLPHMKQKPDNAIEPPRKKLRAK